MVPLVRGLPAGGFLCLNADDPEVLALASYHSGRTVLYGTGENAELRYSNVRSSLTDRLSFDLTFDGLTRRVQTRFVGTLLLPSIVGGLAVIRATGLDLSRSIEDVAAIEPISNRMAVYNAEDGHVYLVDNFKASLWSTDKAIDDLPNLGGERRILVLGEVSDIPNDPGRRYRQLMRRAAQHCALVVGTERAASAAEKLARADPDLNVVGARGPEEVRAILRGQPPSLVIVKGNHMHRWMATYRSADKYARVPVAVDRQ
jgi:UDP-N-acetylmuramoyl-tripeptide--D-alanyl-D-alanine ligase